jgi:hypothetical protein
VAQKSRQVETGRWKLEAASLPFYFLSKTRLTVTARRRRDFKAIEPLKAKDLRGDVQERKTSHF